MHALPGSSWRRAVATAARSFVICLQFYSRLPVPTSIRLAPWTMADFAAAAWLAPAAGLVIGTCAAAAVTAARSGLGLSSGLSATLAVATLVLVGGGLHEDGLADVVDGFGGGASRPRKLEIMRDSRIGAFGTLALILSITLRIGTAASLLDTRGIMAAALALAAAAALSRGFGLLPLAWLPAARPDGLVATAGAVTRGRFLAAAALSVLAGALPVAGGIAAWRALLACALSLAGSGTVTWLAKRQIGGATGDVAGAAQQVCEITYLVALLIAPESR